MDDESAVTAESDWPEYGERQRILIPEPLGVKEYPEYKVPHPVLANGERIQVNAYFDMNGHVLERWMMSETRVDWYRVETESQKRVMVTVPRSAPVKV